MSILTKKAIDQDFRNGKLIKNPRQKDGGFDIEPNSYDLMAGVAVWKTPARDGVKGVVETRFYIDGGPQSAQPTVTVQPGQMIFVITQEDIAMPLNISGTVYSRNSLARKGILALNTGHVDPGYEGLIAVRLINLRSTAWTLVLGIPFFTIVFQTLDVGPDESLIKHPSISKDEMLSNVREMADEALSNALFDVYALEIKALLNEEYTEVETRLRDSLTERFAKSQEDFIRRDDLWPTLRRSLWSVIIAAIVLLAAIFGIVGVVFTILSALGVISNGTS